MPKVINVPAFTDNYIWLICDDDENYAAIVDPGDAAPVTNTLEQRGIAPLAILITHHHGDHVGGINALLNKYPEIVVYGPKNEQIPSRHIALKENDQVQLDKIGITLQVLDTPGHTAGHIVYYGDDIMFCGDTLFASGCGRIFDGTVLDLYQSLGKIAALPPQTQVYCAHEYTLDNIGFAKWVEEDNQELLQREQDCWELIDDDKATVPSTLEIELKTNPFLRCKEPAVIEKAERFRGKPIDNPAEVFAAIRNWKDTEYD